MNCTTPGLPVHHQLLKFTQSHVHWVGDDIQPSHPLSSSFPPALNLSQHQGQMSQLFILGGQSIGVSASASALPMNTQDWSPYSPRDSQESSPTPHFKSINSLVFSFLYSSTLIPIHAAAAASLQSCPTLCNPRDSTPTRLPHLWDFTGKSTGVGCHCLLHIHTWPLEKP